MHGLHLTADLYDCRCEPALLTDAQRLAAACRALVRDAGLAAVDERWHRFPDAGPGGARSAGVGAAGATEGAAADAARGGVTGVVLLAESHFAVHTWPERRGVTLDVYVCNLSQDNSGRAEQLMAAAITRFDPARLSTHRLQRGNLAAASAS
jgi:S-adenosylmethionine/arginine decarboxylase-like enzyme